MLHAGPWLAEFTDLRDLLNRQQHGFGMQHVRAIAEEVQSRMLALGRAHAIPKLSERALARLEAEAAVAAAVAEQQREEGALGRLQTKRARQMGGTERQPQVLVA